MRDSLSYGNGTEVPVVLDNGLVRNDHSNGSSANNSKSLTDWSSILDFPFCNESLKYFAQQNRKFETEIMGIVVISYQYATSVRSSDSRSKATSCNGPETKHIALFSSLLNDAKLISFNLCYFATLFVTKASSLRQKRYGRLGLGVSYNGTLLWFWKIYRRIWIYITLRCFLRAWIEQIVAMTETGGERTAP